LDFISITGSIVSGNALIEDSIDDLMEMTCCENKSEQFVSVQENFEKRLGEVNLTTDVPLISFSQPLLEVFLHRYELFRFIFTTGHLHQIVYGVLYKGVALHDASGDADEIQPVYNLGNDFYYSFLSDPMFYSCGVAYESSESLDVA
jgi:hypothetical protein